MVPPKYTFSYEMKGCPSQPPEIIYFCKFRPKRAWNYAYLACKIIFLGKGAPPPCNHIRKHFDRKGTEIVHFPRNTQSLIKRTAAPCDHQKFYISGGHKGPPEIIYFCKFRPKKGLELCVNSLQIQNFPIVNGTFHPCKPQIVCTCKLWQKRDWKLCIYVSQKYILLSKRRSAPLRPPESYISVNLDQKGPEIRPMHI